MKKEINTTDSNERYKVSIPEEELQFKKGEELAQHRLNAREMLRHTNATPIRWYTDTGYHCCFCSKHYLDPADLKKHNINEHDNTSISKFMQDKTMRNYIVRLDITGLKCNICNKELNKLEIALDHLKVEHNKMIFTDIKNHILPFKFETEELRCFMCFNTFNAFRTLQEHMNVHYRNYICTFCNAGFSARHFLLTHSYEHKVGSYKCKFCTNVYSTLNKKACHEKAAHKGLRHICGFCNERFKEIANKIQHIQLVHGIDRPKIKCQACDKVFNQRKTWMIHNKRDHLMLRQHKCEQCDMAFFTKGELKDHTVKHTGTKEFQCNTCLRLFGRYKTLKEHMKRLHSDVKVNVKRVT